MAISDFIRSAKTDRPEKKKKIQRTIVRRRTKDGLVSIIASGSSVTEPIKRTYFIQTSLVDVPVSNADRVVRLSDPKLAENVQKLSERIKSDPAFAMKLLRKAGIATAAGKLSQHYGG